MELPNSWIEVKLGDIAEILDSKRVPVNSTERNSRISGKKITELFPYYGATGEVGKIDDFILDGGYLLIGEDGAPFLDAFKTKAYLVNGKFWVNNHAHILQFSESNKFFCHYLNQVNFKQYVTGTTRLKLNQAALKEIILLLPPLPEQHRIVTKIEELFSELDKGIESLKTAQQQLKIYRQSLLKHAFSGKLTEQWRADNQDKLETADALLARIQSEREERYQAQLKDWEDNGRQGTKPKAPKVMPPLTDEKLAELPDGWGWTRLGNFIDSIDAGKSFKCSEREPSTNEIGVAKVSAVTWGEYNESESKTCVDMSKVNSNYFIRKGDFILSRANTIELVGACVIAKKVTKQIMLSDKTLRIVFSGFTQEYFLHFLLSRMGRNQIMRLSTGNQESMRNIGQERIQSILIPVCSQLESKIIIAMLALKFSIIDQLEKTITTALQQSEVLRQSILKKAFSGLLVPQDPNDEPASVLLERIKAEKAALINPTIKKTKSGKKTST
jgi:type I restriction enzyme S subunit